MNGPRLYLDTADLITIGDEKVDAGVVAALMRACDRTGTVLVVSLWHVADARNAEPDGRERIFDAVDRFPQRALARLDEDDLDLLPIPSLTSLIREHGDDVQVLNDHVSNATELLQKHEAPTAQPVWLMNLSKRMMLHVLHNAQSRDDAIKLAREFLHKQRRRIPPERVESMLPAIDQAWNLRAQLEEAGMWGPEVLTQAFSVREVSSVPYGTVGEHIGVLVEQRRRGQLDRAVQDGDIADRQHVQFAPYVDIFTGDWDLCTWLDEWRAKLRYERNVVPIGTRRLRDVVAVLETLPSADRE